MSIYRGIVTGCNDAFIIDNDTKRRLIEQHPSSNLILKPLIRGKDISKYKIDWGELWLIDAHNGFDSVSRVEIAEFPAIMNHLHQYWDRLERRQDRGATPYNLRNCAYHAQFETPKIIYPEITQNFPFAFDTSGLFTNNKCFFITGGNLKYLIGWLNCKVFRFLAKSYFPTLQSKGRELRKVHFETLPVPILSAELRTIIEEWVDDVIQKISSNEEPQEIEWQIDQFIFDLYNLTPGEIDTIAGLDSD